jgi:hypothetical protein
MMISKEQAVEQFKQIIGGKASWARLIKSQFVDHLSVFQSWALRDALWKVERTIQEFFLSTALNKSSILAHMEDREYIPRKRVAASGLVAVTNNGGNTIHLPIYAAFVSAAQTEYALMQAATIIPAETVNLGFSQRTVKVMDIPVAEEKSFYEIRFLKEDTERLCQFSVEIDSGVGFETWSYARLFQNAYPESKVYDEFYSHAGQGGIRFGNNAFGAIPSLNAVIRVTMWLTDGDTSLLPSQTLNPVDDLYDDLSQLADMTAVSYTAIASGAAAESLEEVKVNLHYWPTYNEKLVWQDDYEFFIRKQIPGIVWVKAWGEQEQEAETGFSAQNINKIFVSAYASDKFGPYTAWVTATVYAVGNIVKVASGYLECIIAHTAGVTAPTVTVPGANWKVYVSILEAETLTNLTAVHLLNRRFTWVTPVFSAFSCEVTGTVGKTVVASKAIQAISDALNATYGKDSADRKTEANISDIYDIIMKTGYFKSQGLKFQVTTSGKMVPTQLAEMIHIDMAATTITLTPAP